jgi:hypothetical protein
MSLLDFLPWFALNIWFKENTVLFGVNFGMLLDLAFAAAISNLRFHVVHIKGSVNYLICEVLSQMI